MCNFKKVLAMVLAVVMMLSVAAVAFAEYYDYDEDYYTNNVPYVTSPTKGDTTTYIYDGKYGGITTERHKDGTAIAYKDMTSDKTLTTPMVSDVSATKAGTVVTIAGIFTGVKGGKIVWNDPKDPSKGIKEIDGGEVQATKQVQQIGTGSYGIGANDEAGNVTGLNVKSKAPVVTVASRALSDSKIANVVIDADNVQINKNATKGTKAKTIAFAFPQMTKSKQLVIKKGAFNGAKKVRIVVSPKMTSKELKKLKKRLKKQLGATAYKKVKIVRSAA